MTEDHIPHQSDKAICGVKPKLLLPPGSDFEWWTERGVPERELIDWASQFLNHEKTFIDIGAHVGTWSVTYAMLGYRVVAFEPQPHLAALLRAGFATNGVSGRVEVLALSDEEGTATLRAPHLDGGGGSIVRDFDEYPELAISMTVETSTLDKMDISDVGFIKIDVEGNELRVLKGAKKTIDRDHPTIILECWATEKGQQIEALFGYLRDDLHYKFQQVWPETWLAEPA